MNRTFFISAAICALASYGAYSEHIGYDAEAEARERRAIEQNLVRSVATEAMREQAACLARDPADWCNRDLAFREHLRGAQAAANKADYYVLVNHRTERNVFILVALISGWIAFGQARKWLRSSGS